MRRREVQKQKNSERCAEEVQRTWNQNWVEARPASVEFYVKAPSEKDTMEDCCPEWGTRERGRQPQQWQADQRNTSTLSERSNAMPGSP